MPISRYVWCAWGPITFCAAPTSTILFGVQEPVLKVDGTVLKGTSAILAHSKY